MKRILRIGMDVHSTNYTLCAMEPVLGEDDCIFANVQVTPDYKNILLFSLVYVEKDNKSTFITINAA